MNLRYLVVAVGLATASATVLGASRNKTDILGRPIVDIDAVRELYRQEPWVNPLPTFWALERRSNDAGPD
jgi:hypothetical protein